MTTNDESNPKKSRKHNPAWKDDPEQRAARQRTRYEKQKQFAEQHGFSSWAALVTALLNGDVTITKNS